MQPKMYTEFLRRADVVMGIGSSMTKTSFGPSLPPGKVIIHSTNDPSDINKDYAAAHGLVGDAGLVLDAIIEEVARRKENDGGKALEALSAEVAAIKTEWLGEWSAQLDSDEVPINQYRVIRDLMACVDRDEVIITHDSGSPRKQLLPFWQTTKTGSYMGWGKSTQLGYGLGITMGAKMAAPEKLCINVMGDCAVGMTGMDIETAARNQIAILTIVFNNGVMAAEKHVMGTSNRKYNSIDVSGNYAKLAESLNAPSRRVEKPGDIVDGISEAVDATERGMPFLLEFMVKEGYDFSDYPY
jgi:acetolactate synthase-1/2/3 large subunit